MQNLFLLQTFLIRSVNWLLFNSLGWSHTFLLSRTYSRVLGAGKFSWSLQCSLEMHFLKAPNVRYDWYIHPLWIKHLLLVSYQHQWSTSPWLPPISLESHQPAGNAQMAWNIFFGIVMWIKFNKQLVLLPSSKPYGRWGTIVQDKEKVQNDHCFFLLSFDSKRHNRFHGQELHE